jgi:hypothetical protein
LLKIKLYMNISFEKFLPGKETRLKSFLPVLYESFIEKYFSVISPAHFPIQKVILNEKELLR